MENRTSNQEKELIEMAQKRVKKLKDFYIHLFFYCLGILVFIAKTYFGAPLNFFPIRYINRFVMSIWTFFMALQIFQLFFSEIIFGKKWEERKIKEFMNRENNNLK
jgi:hypothetical protein